MVVVVIHFRKLGSTKSMNNEGLKCAIDHILDAQQKGEINEDNVLYIVENINVAGMLCSALSFLYPILSASLFSPVDLSSTLHNYSN